MSIGPAVAPLTPGILKADRIVPIAGPAKLGQKKRLAEQTLLCEANPEQAEKLR